MSADRNIIRKWGSLLIAAFPLTGILICALP